MKKLLFCLQLLCLNAFSQDTIFVKKVFINNRPVKVKSGYILKKEKGKYLVNGKEMWLIVYKQTDNADFKPEQQQIITNK